MYKTIPRGDIERGGTWASLGARSLCNLAILSEVPSLLSGLHRHCGPLLRSSVLYCDVFSSGVYVRLYRKHQSKGPLCCALHFAPSMPLSVWHTICAL